MTLSFIVPGRPVSQPRPRVTRRGTFMPADYTEYRETVTAEAQVAAFELEQRGEPWDARAKSYRVRMKFFMPDQRRSDIDKLEATILDALTNAGVFEDDRLVDSVRKDRAIDAGRPRVEVEVEVLSAMDSNRVV